MTIGEHPYGLGRSSHISSATTFGRKNVWLERQRASHETCDDDFEDTQGLRTGDAIVYRNGDGANASLGGLTDGKTYYVIAQSDGKIQLASTQQKALAGDEINLTSKGSGSGHRLVFDRSHTFRATAIAGASGGDTGVAGALAINIGLSAARAEIAAEATIKLTDGGDLTLTAENFVVNVASSAASQSGASKTGVGASVALNIGINDTVVAVGDEAVLTDAEDIKLSAASANEMSTEAEGGSKGATAVTPVIAVTVAVDDTQATLGTLTTGGPTTIKGELSASATHDGVAQTTATGDTKSGDTGVGISLALTVAVSDATATTARDLTAGRAVSFAARNASANKTHAKASVAGGDDSGGEWRQVRDQTRSRSPSCIARRAALSARVVPIFETTAHSALRRLLHAAPLRGPLGVRVLA